MGQSAPTFVASDRTFTIDLSDAIFNQIEGQCLAGPLIDAGEEGAAVVTATITQTASSAPPTPVPDTGSTAALLGLGLLAMALRAKRLLPTGQVPLHQLASEGNPRISQIHTDGLGKYANRHLGVSSFSLFFAMSSHLRTIVEFWQVSRALLREGLSAPICEIRGPSTILSAEALA